MWKSYLVFDNGNKFVAKFSMLEQAISACLPGYYVVEAWYSGYDDYDCTLQSEKIVYRNEVTA